MARNKICRIARNSDTFNFYYMGLYDNTTIITKTVCLNKYRIDVYRLQPKTPYIFAVRFHLKLSRITYLHASAVSKWLRVIYSVKI